MADDNLHIIYCNGASPHKKKGRRRKGESIILNHDPNLTHHKRNVNIRLNNFVGSVHHLDDRVKDLLEIAGYVYAADRNIFRGPPNAVEFQNWDRQFHFVFNVRDYSFWNQNAVKQALSEALCFMSGDKSYEFTFQKGRGNLPMNLFDQEEFKINPNKKTAIVLFSGGLDSLTGTIERLTKTEEDICLISHLSGQPGTKKTQKKLVEALNRDFENRCSHFKFYCNLIGGRGVEETQRTRSFLYSSIAFALATAFSQNSIYFYENGITSINFPKRQDLKNARASRTTHLKTLGLLQKFFDLFREEKIKIEHPFFFKTKSDVVQTLAELGKKDIFNSSVSCSKTFLKFTQHTHCGKCSQCVDRRFAMYATNLQDYDGQGNYDFDFIKHPFHEDDSSTAKKTTIDHIRLALGFTEHNLDSFYQEHLDELKDLDDFIDGSDETDRIEKVFALCKRHGEQIEKAIENIRSIHDKPSKKRTENTLLSIIANQDYLKSPIQRLVEDIGEKLSRAIPIAFPNNKQPEDEFALNNFVNAFIEDKKIGYTREFPVVKFAMAKTIPDHSFDNNDLFIEVKYPRGKTSKSTITDGIGSDLSKYPTGKHILFIIYDPERKITEDDIFKREWEMKGNCTIKIIR